MSTREVAKTLALIVGGIVAGLVLFEAYARLQGHESQWLDRMPFRATRPPPYQTADYFGADLLRESEQVIRLKTPAGTRLLALDDYTGRLMNVQDGRRVTTDQPATFRSRILMFGSSNLFSAEVPDRHTIASNLQRLVNAGGQGAYKVENHAVPSTNTVQELGTFRGVDTRKGDIVIFFDGANDLYRGVLYKNFDGYIVGEHNTLFGSASLIDRIALQLAPVSPYLASIRLLRGKIDTREPDHLFRPREVSALAALAGRIFAWNKIEAALHARRHEASLFFFLTPTLFSYPRRTAYQDSLNENPLLTPPGSEAAVRTGEPFLTSALQELRSAGLAGFDLRDLIVRELPGKEVFLDFAHMNHEANALIATAIFHQLAAAGFKSSDLTLDLDGAERMLGRLPAAPEITGPGGNRDKVFAVYPWKGGEMIGVPRRLGHVFWRGIDISALPDTVVGASYQEIAARFRDFGPR